MPYSTSSSDSGYGIVHRSSNCNSDRSATASSKHVTSSAITDDEESLRCTNRTNDTFVRMARGKSRRFRKKPISSSDSSSHSSCSSSDVNSLTGEDERRYTLSCEDIIKKIYVYFQSLLVTIQRQQKFLEQIGGYMADRDARWGAGGLRKGWEDPSGCFASFGFNDPSKPNIFPGCWAIPHPAVHLALLSNNIHNYLDFLSWLYPDIVGCGVGPAATPSRTGSPLDELSQQRSRAPEIAISEDILPILMQLMQQMGPINGGGSSTIPAASVDDAFMRQDKMRQHLQQLSAHSTGGWSVQPTLMQQLMTQLNQMHFVQQQHHKQTTAATAAAAAAAVKTSTATHVLNLSSSKSTLPDATQRPATEYYSTVVARGPATSGESSCGSSKTSTFYTGGRHNVTTSKLERKVRPCSATEGVSLGVSGVSVTLGDDIKTSCGKSINT